MHATLMQRENGEGGLSSLPPVAAIAARSVDKAIEAKTIDAKSEVERGGAAMDEGARDAARETKREAPFALSFDVRWADCDPNRHLRHSSYADYATHVRFAYIEAQGFALHRFEEERFGPVIFREETQYLREVRLGERVKFDFEVLGFSEDHIRWSVMHTVWNEAGKRAAILLLDGCWLHMDTRKAIVPPDDLRDIMRRLPVGKVPSYKRFLR